MKGKERQSKYDKPHIIDRVNDRLDVINKRAAKFNGIREDDPLAIKYKAYGQIIHDFAYSAADGRIDEEIARCIIAFCFLKLKEIVDKKEKQLKDVQEK